MIELWKCALHLLACHVFPHQNQIVFLLWGKLLLPFGLFLVILFVVHYCFEQRFIEDEFFVNFTSNVCIQLISLTLHGGFYFRFTAFALEFCLSLHGYFRNVELSKVHVMIAWNFIFLEVAEVVLIFALIAVLFKVISGEHLAHIQGFSLLSILLLFLPLDGIISLSLILILMEEALLMFVEFGLQSCMDFFLCTDEGFLELVVQTLSVALEIGFSSGLLLFHFDVVELINVKVLPAPLVHGSRNKSLLEFGRNEHGH